MKYKFVKIFTIIFLINNYIFHLILKNHYFSLILQIKHHIAPTTKNYTWLPLSSDSDFHFAKQIYLSTLRKCIHFKVRPNGIINTSVFFPVIYFNLTDKKLTLKHGKK
ncbi:hypothetical protein Lalb_Chr08g0242191 [Lupinus albus]|uniref:Uncharacterized protein n=1 Tax=Lupinus albus TaxID=3870 RepID=A0A6A4Q4I5_LUPAL|nr:hypothetical protein Lalb_Chr08g0242191 [Lupinus albus]